jgi:hypothetical protein
VPSRPHLTRDNDQEPEENKQKIIESKRKNAKKAGATQNIGPYKAHKRREQRE